MYFLFPVSFILKSLVQRYSVPKAFLELLESLEGSNKRSIPAVEFSPRSPPHNPPQPWSKLVSPEL